MPSLDDENVQDLLFGDTDVRDVALFLGQRVSPWTQWSVISALRSFRLSTCTARVSLLFRPPGLPDGPA